ncbi:MAG: helix-turn-helix domain-containing protein [Acidimicrobiales bacterium]
MPVAGDTFGSTLRWWRTTRRYSQMQLANEAEVSSRHLSFLETGRAQPSREMVVHLARVLDVPLRDCNVLLHSAGFAPAYSHSDLDAPEMDDVRNVLVKIIDAHTPNPAVVVDRRGEVVEANAAAMQLIGATVSSDSPALGPSINIHRISLHPDGVKARSGNWAVVAANILQRLERELAHRPADDQLEALLTEVLAYPDVAPLRRNAALPTGADLLLPLHLETFDSQELRLISTIATIGAPYDVTLDELRLETFFPADDATGDVLAGWAVA